MGRKLGEFLFYMWLIVFGILIGAGIDAYVDSVRGPKDVPGHEPDGISQGLQGGPPPNSGNRNGLVPED